MGFKLPEEPFLSWLHFFAAKATSSFSDTDLYYYFTLLKKDVIWTSKDKKRVKKKKQSTTTHDWLVETVIESYWEGG